MNCEIIIFLEFQEMDAEFWINKSNLKIDSSGVTRILLLPPCQACGRGCPLQLSGLPENVSKPQQFPGSYLLQTQDMEEAGHLDLWSAERKSDCDGRVLSVLVGPRKKINLFYGLVFGGLRAEEKTHFTYFMSVRNFRTTDDNIFIRNLLCCVKE